MYYIKVTGICEIKIEQTITEIRETFVKKSKWISRLVVNVLLTKQAFFSNKKYDSYECWTCAGWVVMFLDSHAMVFTFLSWLDWLGVALTFRISFLKFFKLLPKYWYRATDMTSFEKYLESCSGHNVAFYLNTVSRICFGRNLSLGFYGDLVYNLRKIKGKREVPRDVRNSNVRKQDKFRRDWSRHYAKQISSHRALK